MIEGGEVLLPVVFLVEVKTLCKDQDKRSRGTSSSSRLKQKDQRNLQGEKEWERHGSCSVDAVVVSDEFFMFFLSPYLYWRLLSSILWSWVEALYSYLVLGRISHDFSFQIFFDCMSRVSSLECTWLVVVVVLVARHSQKSDRYRYGSRKKRERETGKWPAAEMRVTAVLYNFVSFTETFCPREKRGESHIPA